MFLFFSIPKDIRPFFVEQAKKENKSKRQLAKELISYFYTGKVEQKKRTDYYDSIGRQ